MGIYINQPMNFKNMKQGIFVDKTGMIPFLNSRMRTEDRYVCVSRPRKFGKTMAAAMLAEYYMKGIDSWETFKDLKIADDPSCKTHINKYNVIFLDIQALWEYSNCNFITLRNEIETKLQDDLRNEFPSLPNHLRDLPELLSAAHSSAGALFIFIVDNWDYVVRQDIHSTSAYLSYLAALLKDKTYAALCYMTGILPVHGYSSSLNMFDNFTMLDPADLAEYAGFTGAEAKSLCSGGMDYHKAKEWYGGYRLNGISIYNPMSMASAARRKAVRSFWMEAETLESIIGRNLDNLHDTLEHLLYKAGNMAKINPNKFRGLNERLSSRDEALALLAHLGYLGFDSSTNQVFIPNKEVEEEFRVVANHYGMFSYN
jgi:hypothetical protein